MRNMLDRIRERRARLGRDGDSVTDEQIERQLVREDEQAVIRQHSDGRRSETTGY